MRCDILLVHYKYCPISFLLRKGTGSNYNHVALIIDDTCMIEAKPTGIRKSKIDNYSNKILYKTKLLRIKGLTEEEKKKIIEIAEVQVGDRYNCFVYLYNLYLNWRNKPTCFVNCCNLVALSFAIINKNFRGDNNIVKTTPQNIIDYVKGHNLIFEDVM